MDYYLTTDKLVLFDAFEVQELLKLSLNGGSKVILVIQLGVSQLVLHGKCFTSRKKQCDDMRPL